jgi:hypothetical protein
MDLFYRNARLPKDDKTLRIVNAAATRLFLKLNDLDINQLEVSDYTKVCIGSSLSMAEIVRQYGCGVIAESFTLIYLATALNRTSAEQWVAMRGLLSLLQAI